MRKLKIGSERFTEVYAADEPGPGGACHKYLVITKDGHTTMSNIKLQKGPVKEAEANGCFNEDLIAIVIDRLEGFQSGDFACRENEVSLTYLKQALNCLDERTKDRQNRGVEGTSKQ